MAVCAVSKPIIRASERSPASVVKPASRSPRIVEAASSPRGRSACSTWMRTRNADETTIRAAVVRKTTPVLATPNRTPASAGPANTAMLSTPLATAFAAVSSSGVRASDGVSAACEERNGVVAIVAAIASP